MIDLTEDADSEELERGMPKVEDEDSSSKSQKTTRKRGGTMRELKALGEGTIISGHKLQSRKKKQNW